MRWQEDGQRVPHAARWTPIAAILMGYTRRLAPTLPQNRRRVSSVWGKSGWRRRVQHFDITCDSYL
jgi:hypothetical protein